MVSACSQPAVIFFFAGYLTSSEVFPLEVRAKAIAVFFAIAQFFGTAPTIRSLA